MNPCVVCLCSVLEDDIWNLYWTQSDRAGKRGRVCPLHRSAAGSQRGLMGKDPTMEIRSILDA